MAERPLRTVLVASAGVVVAAAVVFGLALRDDDLPWVVWKLEGVVERGATPLPVLGVASAPGGETIDGDWRVYVRGRNVGEGGEVERIWETLERPRPFGAFWQWWGRRTDRPWLGTSCVFAEYDETVTTGAGRWRLFVREPLPGDTWCRRPDAALAGRWQGWFVESYPNRSSSLVFHADGAVGGLVHPPGHWGVRDDVLVMTWGEGTIWFGSWQGRRTGPARFESFEGPFGRLEKE